ncbi:MAG: MFS transporter [Defluviitaleaceae bacterium]|nr:MFS transporter [Defluviitaleaceae bacterium]
MKTFNKKALYLYKFVGQCLPIYAFYPILFLNRGMSVSEVLVLIALWSVFNIVFELPAGILADKWNKRNILAIAAALQGVCYVIWFFSHSFFAFALGFFFWGAAGAFTSGTEEGLIYDNLKSDGHEDEFAKVYGRAHFFATIGTLVGIGSAGLIAVFVSIEVIALMSAAICFINVIFALRIRERNLYAKDNEGEPKGAFETLKKATSFLKGNGIAVSALLFLVLLGIGPYMDEFDALIADDWEVSVLWVSGILLIRFGFVALGDILAPIVEKRIKSIRQIFLLNALGCVVLTAFAFLWQWYAVLFFGIAFMLMAITQILLVNALQKEIKEEGRATVMSFFGIGQNIAMICLSLVFAALAGIFTLQQIYIFVAVYGVLGSLVFCVLFLRVKK